MEKRAADLRRVCYRVPRIDQADNLSRNRRADAFISGGNIHFLDEVPADLCDSGNDDCDSSGNVYCNIFLVKAAGIMLTIFYDQNTK